MQATTLSTLHSYLTCCSGATCSTALVPLHLAMDAEEPTIATHSSPYSGPTSSPTLVLLLLAIQATKEPTPASYCSLCSDPTSGASMVLLLLAIQATKEPFQNYVLLVMLLSSVL